MLPAALPRILGLIAARGGSKGLPGKNTMDFAGKPLIAWTIERAMESRYLTDVVVTTDSPQIRQAALQHGARVPFLRPDDLATDESNVNDAVLHAIDYLQAKEAAEYDYVALLQPTQPLRPAGFVDQAFDYFFESRKSESNSMVTVVEAESKAAYLMGESPDGFVNFLLVDPRSAVNRQDLPIFYYPAGLFYVAPVSKYRKERTFYGSDTIGMIVSREICADIDNRDDFDRALAWYRGNSGQSFQ